MEVINKKFKVPNFDPDARGSRFKDGNDVIRFGLPIDVICVKTEGEGKETKFEVKSVELAEDKI